MASTPIKVNTLIKSLTLIVATELLGWALIRSFDMHPLTMGALVRITQVVTLGWVVIREEESLSAIGWSPGAWLTGLRKGAVWSLAFAAAAGAGMVALHLSGHNPLQWIRSPLPSNAWELSLFFLVGGIIAPVAEELFFRGILYTFFRRWGIPCALVASTAIFVGLHLPQGIPLTQIVGGIVFAIAYETTGNLMVPMTIHSLGNLSIFSLSLM